MGIKVKNEIDDSGKAREVVFELHLPMHSKHSNHLKKDESYVFEWGIGGKCDDKAHKISCKVNLPGSDEHPDIEAKSGDTVVVRYKDKEYILEKYIPA